MEEAYNCKVGPSVPSMHLARMLHHVCLAVLNPPPTTQTATDSASAECRRSALSGGPSFADLLPPLFLARPFPRPPPADPAGSGGDEVERCPRHQTHRTTVRGLLGTKAILGKQKYLSSFHNVATISPRRRPRRHGQVSCSTSGSGAFDSHQDCTPLATAVSRRRATILTAM